MQSEAGFTLKRDASRFCWANTSRCVQACDKAPIASMWTGWQRKAPPVLELYASARAHARTCVCMCVCVCVCVCLSVCLSVCLCKFVCLRDGH